MEVLGAIIVCVVMFAIVVLAFFGAAVGIIVKAIKTIVKAFRREED